MSSGTTRPPVIAVVGASALFPGSVDGQSFWRNILAGRDLLSDVPPDHWLVEDYHDPDPSAPGKIYATRGGFLPKVDFDPLRQGIPPKQLSTTDTAQLLSLVVAERVLDDAASVQFGKVDRRRMSVILGVASATELVGQMAARIQRPHWVQALRDSGLPESRVQEICDRIEGTYPEWDESTFPGLLGNVVAGRIANRLDLGGTNCVIDAACASSLGAVAMAVQELQLGHSDLVITGGVDALNDTFMYMCFSKTPALSPSGDCRPFSDAADGTMLGEGIGMVALRRLEDAERDGDRIYAVLRGVGSSSDGRAKSIYAPRAEGQEVAIRRAYEKAGYGPGEVGLVEAHGTATKAGDAAEFEGLTRSFGDTSRADTQWCALGSVKSQIGHTKAAAGAASLFKVVMALHQKVLPPTIKVERPNGKLEIEKSPFYLNTRARPWIESPSVTRKGSVSSFGFGGSNFHVALEEYVGPGARAPRTSSLPTHLLLVGAPDSATLLATLRALTDEIATTPLRALAKRSQLTFDPRSACRLAVLADDEADAASRLATAISSIAADGTRAFSVPHRVHYAVGADRPKLAFLFPGQGSQYVDMGAELAIEFAAARRVWDESAGFEVEGGSRLHQLVFPIPAFTDEARGRQAAALTRTDVAQPAIGAVSLSMLRLLEALGVRPDAAAGHSYGEIAALYAAGSIGSAAEVLAISRRRGELMREAARLPGSMTAVQADIAQVEALLTEPDGQGVALANINSPRQVVVAGETAAVEGFEGLLKDRGIRFQRLPVATAFHTSLVAPSAEPFREFLGGLDLATPRIPVYANATAQRYGDEPGEIRATLAGQLARPVRFHEMIERMHADGCRLFVEVGPGSVLTGMVADCLADRPHVSAAMDARRRDGRAGLLDVLGVLSTQGIAIDFQAFWSEFADVAGHDEGVQRSPATVQLNGTNYGKPYPPLAGAAGRTPPNPEVPVAPRPEMVSTPQVSPAMAAEAPVADPLTAAVAPPAPAALDAGWSSAFIAMQQQTLEAQKEFTRALSESHQAFLRASEAAFAQLGALRGDGAPRDHAAPHPDARTTTAPVGLAHAAPAASPPPVAPAPVVVAPPAAPAASVAPRVDYAALLLEVVAEKTGYPTEMLTLDMELEAGLGIDSIKRVEILSVLQDRVPGLAAVDTSELAALNTLGEIVAFAAAAVGSVVASPDPASSAPGVPMIDTASTNGAGAESPAEAAPPGEDYAGLLLAVVAEKTGYPVEMLTLDMELEAGLGIDSIKRVEILSVLQDRVPALALVDTSELASLNTLGEIVAFAARAAGDGDDPRDEPVVEPAADAEVADAERLPFLRRFAIAATDAPASGLTTPGLLAADPLYLVGGDPAIAAALAAALASADIRAVPVDAVPERARAVVLLTGLGADGDPAALAALNEAVFLELSACASSMAGGGLLVTVQDTGGDFGISGGAGCRAWSAGIAAGAKTAALEWPLVSVKAIDIDRGRRTVTEIADALCVELLAGGPRLEVGLRADGRRVAPELREEVAAPLSAPLDPEGVLVVSGGARGVTPACIGALLERGSTRVAILGRTPLADEPPGLEGLITDADLKAALLRRHRDAGRTPTPQELGAEARRIQAQRELRRNLDALTALGSDVRYYAADVTDAGEVATTLDLIRRTQGPIRALVHAAGVLADREIARKTPEQFRLVFATKVAGFRNLLAATRDDALTHIACFSSIAAWRGNVGQVDYAMANEVLNRVCEAEAARRGPACLVKSIGWGPWEGGMVDAALEKHFASIGVSLIPQDAGARFFADEITGEHGRAVEVVYGAGLEGFAAATGRIVEEAVFEARIHASTHPYLADHSIRDLPVVPVVTALDLALHAVSAFRPSARIAGSADLKVLKGISLPGFHDGGDVVRVECRATPGDAETVGVRILSADGLPHYTLRVRLGDPADGNAGVGTIDDLEPWTPESGEIYDGRLFHGPAFQSITELEGLSESGCAGTLRSTQPGVVGFPLDLDVLDGGLQLAVLWVHEQVGCESLPTGFDAFTIHATPARGEAVRCEARCTMRSQLATRWSLRYVSLAGEPLCTLEGVQIHLLPETRKDRRESAAAALDRA